jgi:demethylmenaquinone methyltransferase/2-methoxy-6-polyprenyl-1,4-benzoquinol methylase
MDDRLARRPHAIRAMFGEVAPRYDLLNRLLSMRRDVAWRRRLVAALAYAPAGPVLDLATGTGDVALAIRERTVVGGDFCIDMLALAARKAQKVRRWRRAAAWTAADALALPFADRTFAAVTIAFGVRNFLDLTAAFQEIRRVLSAGGVLAVLELHRPRLRAVAAALRLWNRFVVAPLGGVISPDGGAYTYLPASVDTFPDRVEMAEYWRPRGSRSSRARIFPAGLPRSRWRGGRSHEREDPGRRGSGRDDPRARGGTGA